MGMLAELTGKDARSTLPTSGAYRRREQRRHLVLVRRSDGGKRNSSLFTLRALAPHPQNGATRRQSRSGRGRFPFPHHGTERTREGGREIEGLRPALAWHGGLNGRSWRAQFTQLKRRGPWPRAAWPPRPCNSRSHGQRRLLVALNSPFAYHSPAAPIAATVSRAVCLDRRTCCRGGVRGILPELKAEAMESFI